MQLPKPIDSKYLDKVRYKGEYYPFSPKYNKEINQKLLQDAQSNGVSENALNIIRLGDYFHNDFHLKFTNELVLLHGKIGISTEELKELFIAQLNEQELLNRIQKNKFFDTTKQLTAFDMQNAVEITKNLPHNPQNFTARSEGMVEFGNHFLRYLSSSQKQNTIDTYQKSESDIFEILKKVTEITNKYHVIKNHYDSSLFLGGKIEIIEQGKIYFDSCISDLELINQIANTIVENQRLNRYYHYEYLFKENEIAKQSILQNSSPRILTEVKVESGFVKYDLRKRTLDDYDVYSDFQITLHDYYSFYSKKILSHFHNLTVYKLLQLHSELKNLVTKLYHREFPKENVNIIEKFKKNFLPKIRHSVLKSYLLSVTTCNESQVESFIELITTKDTPRLNLYATHLLKNDNYYYFLYFPLSNANYLFLIDYWLTEAGENLSLRGKALEEYLKNKLKSTKEKEHNIFRVIDESKFTVSKEKKEEIDVLIETKNTLIIGEVKCIKHPMYERDYYGTLNDDIAKAIEQLNRKSRFLIDNQNHFKNLFSLDGKKIIKVIILNYPAFTGITVEGIPIIDTNLFLSYFQSGQLTAREFGQDDMKEVSIIPYYSNEEEFCNNFENYLQINPLVKMYSEQLSKQRCSYKIDGLPEIIFEDINPINKESMLQEAENSS